MAWETRTAMPTVWSFVVCAAYQGLVYVHRWSSSSSNIQVYDPDGDSWSTIALPGSVTHGGGLAADDNYLYLYGGTTALNFTITNTYRWDGSSWTGIDALPEARNQCVADSDGTYQAIVGGTKNEFNGAYKDNFWTRTSGSWTTETVSPRARDSGTYRIAAVDGKVYVAGGQLLGSVNTALHDIGTIGGSWATGAALNEAIFQYGMAADGTHLYIVGGNDGSGRELLTRRYTIATDTWDTLDNLPAARQLNDCAVVGQYLYSIGGNTSGSPSGDGAVLRLALTVPRIHVGSVRF